MELKGQIEEIIFSNENNSYTVCSMSVNGGDITAVGYLPFLNIGDLIVAHGEFVNHNLYGKQFKINTFEKAIPNTTNEIEKYLGSGIIKGIGPATSKKIVNKFGEDTIYTLQYEPEKLTSIKGITKSRAMEISESFNNVWELWQIVIFLQQYGIGTVNANRIYKEYGMNAINAIKENPYALLNILYGVDFKHIDKMALSMGIESTSSFRVSSGIKYALNLAARNGHTCVLEVNLVEYVSNVLDVERDLVKNELTALTYSKEIYREDEFVFLKDYYEAEETVAKKLLMLSRNFTKKIHSIDSKIEETERELNIELSKEQRDAVKACFENQLVIITGGPGTGKTTIIKVLIHLFKKQSIEVALCAPTGRAAKRMEEATSEDAKTLHRLLELGKMEENKLNLEYTVNKIKQQVVIVDEMSMVDIVLMNYLVRGLLENTKLILIGDCDQLASVGPGSVLNDLIESDVFVTKRLTEIYRQAAESKIVTNAHKINDGDKEIVVNEKSGDFFFIRENNIVEQIIELVSTRLPKLRKIWYTKRRSDTNPN